MNDGQQHPGVLAANLHPEPEPGPYREGAGHPPEEQAAGADIAHGDFKGRRDPPLLPACGSPFHPGGNVHPVPGSGPILFGTPVGKEDVRQAGMLGGVNLSVILIDPAPLKKQDHGLSAVIRIHQPPVHSNGLCLRIEGADGGIGDPQAGALVGNNSSSAGKVHG